MSDIPRLTRPDELSELFERSRRDPVWVFKHSVTCEVSAVAWDEFRRFADAAGDGSASFALVEVQSARKVSNELARLTGVRHESPQVLLLRDGRAVWSASHWAIRGDELEAAARAT